MVMKLRVASLDDVPEAFHGEYAQDGDGYVLQTEGDHPGIEAMRRARDNEKESHKATKQRIKELETEMDNMRTQLATSTGNSDNVHKSWEKKFNDKCAEYDGIINGLNGSLSNLTVGQAAKQVADIFLSPRLGEREARARLTTEMVDGVPTVRVLDKDGKPGAMSLDDLIKEFRADKDLAPSLKGTSGSGGGNPPPGPGGKHKATRPEDMGDAERAELLKTDPAKFHELFPRKGRNY